MGRAGLVDGGSGSGMTRRRRSGPSFDQMAAGPSLGMLKIELGAALCELAARGELTGADLRYGLRLIVRTGLDGKFYEGLETSSRAVGISRKSAGRAREKYVALGFLEETGGNHAPGRPRRFAVRIPAEILAAYQARLAGDPPSTGDKTLSPVEGAEGESYRGQPETQQGTNERLTGDKMASNRGQSFVPETSEPLNLKEPGREARSLRSAAAPSVAAFRKAAPRGNGMTEQETEERRALLRRQAEELRAQEAQEAGRVGG